MTLASITSDLLTMGVPVLDKVLRTLLVYLGLVLLLRVAGKRDLAQLTSFDLVVLLLLSNVVQNAIIGPDNSLWGGMLGAAVLLAFNGVVVRVINRSRVATRVLQGTPTRLVHDGVLDEQALTRLALSPDEVTEALRRQGVDDLATVEEAWLTPEGAFSVHARPAPTISRADLDRLEAKVDRLLAAS